MSVHPEKTAYQILENRINYADDMYQAAKAADVLVILTEWMQFAEADLTRLAQLMKQRKIFDFRNLLNVEDVKKAGFEYQCIGRCINNENKGE